MSQTLEQLNSDTGQLLQSSNHTSEIQKILLGIGEYYENGKGLVIKTEEAFKLFKSAAELGCLEAMIQLASCYAHGKWTEANPKEAFKWYLKIAEFGEKIDVEFVAQCYERGNFCEQSYTKAFEWHQRAAKLGSKKGMLALGAFYARGSAVTQDMNMAVKWYQSAAKSGCQHSINQLNCNIPLLAILQKAEGAGIDKLKYILEEAFSLAKKLFPQYPHIYFILADCMRCFPYIDEIDRDYCRMLAYHKYEKLSCSPKSEYLTDEFYHALALLEISRMRLCFPGSLLEIMGKTISDRVLTDNIMEPFLENAYFDGSTTSSSSNTNLSSSSTNSSSSNTSAFSAETTVNTTSTTSSASLNNVREERNHNSQDFRNTHFLNIASLQMRQFSGENLHLSSSQNAIASQIHKSLNSALIILSKLKEQKNIYLYIPFSRFTHHISNKHREILLDALIKECEDMIEKINSLKTAIQSSTTADLKSSTVASAVQTAGESLERPAKRQRLS